MAGLTRWTLTRQLSTLCNALAWVCNVSNYAVHICSLRHARHSCPRNAHVQGDRERALGLPSSTIRDRSRVDVPSSQVSELDENTPM